MDGSMNGQNGWISMPHIIHSLFADKRTFKQCPLGIGV